MPGELVQVQLRDQLVEVDNSPARVTELPFVQYTFAGVEAAAQAAAAPSVGSRAASLAE